MADKPWGGRFEEELDQAFARMNASVDVDQRLWAQDLAGSRAHARMLASRGILTPSELAAIEAGLEQIGHDIRAGKMEWRIDREDVHMNIEAVLTERIGEAGGKLHTARSRNDQVATDMRLFVRDACKNTQERIDRVLSVLLERACGTVDVVMPGYTHLQRAQPVRLAHHLLAWAEMLERDHSRFADAAQRMNESPLGAAALAGTTFDIDREATARELGFDRPMRNSIDAVSDRDFSLEALSALSILSVHLSRIAEELVLWSSQEFGFVEMTDRFTTGSSIMPQKKNPDMAELVRGKTGRVIGDLVSLLVTMKGLPLAYNRDMQEDKRPVFDAFDTLDDCLDVLAGALATTRFDAERMKAALSHGFVDATEVADWLAARGVPFRVAHHVSGRLVRYAISQGKTLAQLSLEEWKREHELFDRSIFEAIDIQTAIERRAVVGGPARACVLGALADLRSRLAARGVDAEQRARELGALQGVG